jgi:uncharacterized membrane protein
MNMSAAQDEVQTHEIEPLVSGNEMVPVYAAAIRALRIGFRVGAALLVVGLVWAAIRGESLGREVDPIDKVLPTLFDGHASGLIDLAILCIMATPVAAVIMVARGFYRIGDRSYALLTLIVLAILGVSIGLSLFE